MNQPSVKKWLVRTGLIAVTYDAVAIVASLCFIAEGAAINIARYFYRSVFRNMMAPSARRATLAFHHQNAIATRSDDNFMTSLTGVRAGGPARQITQA